MDDDKAQKVRSILPAGMGAGVGALLILLFGRSVVLSPFETTRPAERRLTIGQVRPNMIDARLWEDPLRAVSDYAEESSDHRIASGTPEGRRALLGTLPAVTGSPGQAPKCAVAILAVALDGELHVGGHRVEAAHPRRRVSARPTRTSRGRWRLIWSRFLVKEGEAVNRSSAGLRDLPLRPVREGLDTSSRTPAKLSGAVVVWWTKERSPGMSVGVVTTLRIGRATSGEGSVPDREPRFASLPGARTGDVPAAGERRRRLGWTSRRAGRWRIGIIDQRVDPEYERLSRRAAHTRGTKPARTQRRGGGAQRPRPAPHDEGARVL